MSSESSLHIGLDLNSFFSFFFVFVFLLEIVLQNICKIYESEFGFKSVVVGGYQKGLTLGGKTADLSWVLFSLQNRVAKIVAKFLHLSWDLSQGS